MKSLFAGKIWRAAGASFACIALTWIVAQVVPPLGAVPGRNPFRAGSENRPLVIAHAGGAGLHPENTWPAFNASVALGCDMLEMDARLTRDGVLVTHHDATVQRTSDGKGAVIEHTLAELKELNFGARFRDAGGNHPYRERRASIATIKELFERFPKQPMCIELKDRGETGRRAAATLASLIAGHGMADRILVASFDDATLNAFRQATRDRVATSTARGQTKRFLILQRLWLDRFWPDGALAAQVPCDVKESSGWSLAKPGFISAAHARNMAVHYWTVNDPEEMRRLIEMGADGLITDYPDRMKRMLAEMNR
jgi:glycerophosphoryl diester phosphodiesterase